MQILDSISPFLFKWHKLWLVIAKAKSNPCQLHALLTIQVDNQLTCLEGISYCSYDFLLLYMEQLCRNLFYFIEFLKFTIRKRYAEFYTNDHSKSFLLGSGKFWFLQKELYLNIGSEISGLNTDLVNNNFFRKYYLLSYSRVIQQVSRTLHST